jgi:CubicO group peptidase (beta-lactamase class C family)
MRLLLALFLATSLSAQTLDTRAVDRVMTATLQQWQIPGAALAIVQNDRVVYLKAYGTKDGTQPVTPDTLFQIASTSKAFTSTALAMLASDGKLSFDDPVRKHVPYFRLADVCADSQVTLRDIVTHRTGLARRDELWDDTPFTREDVVRKMASVSLARPFRTSYGYHNIMFITAGEAVTHTSGMPWDDFVRTRIFQPLGMTHTVLSDAEWNASTDRATGYAWDVKNGRMKVQTPIDTTTIGAGGAIKSSARDMAQWIRFQLAGGTFDGKQLVKPELLAETKMPHTVIRLEGTTKDVNPQTNVLTYAMGWNVQDHRGEQLVAHAGALNGFRTQVALLPKRNIGMVLLINAGRGWSLLGMRNAIVDILLDGRPSRDWSTYYLTLDRESDAKAATDKATRLTKRVPNTTPTRPLAEYAGAYTNEAYGPAKVSLADGALVLEWSRIKAPLTHYHYDVFDAAEEEHALEETVTFALDDEKKVKSLTLFGETFTKKF